ncbi:hypothetical protein FB451DRAFT_1187879 [Mycena latifolia]|nr:hypothetical protein FB451DRAFT_1187879 [Mycena latifolia]
MTVSPRIPGTAIVRRSNTRPSVVDGSSLISLASRSEPNVAGAKYRISPPSTSTSQFGATVSSSGVTPLCAHNVHEEHGAGGGGVHRPGRSHRLVSRIDSRSPAKKGLPRQELSLATAVIYAARTSRPIGTGRHWPPPGLNGRTLDPNGNHWFPVRLPSPTGNGPH